MVFTGLVQTVGRALFCKDDQVLIIKADDKYWHACKKGDSIAVNGCCLTLLEETRSKCARFFIMEESRDKVNLCNHGIFRNKVLENNTMNIKTCDDVGFEDEALFDTTLYPTHADQITWVNLEKAMTYGDHMGGHTVTGHIDAMVKLKSICPCEDGSHRLCIDVSQQSSDLSEKFKYYTVKKGSITLNGISLTIANVSHQKLTLEVCIIIHTWNHTTLQYTQVDDWINIEYDQHLKQRYEFLSSGIESRQWQLMNMSTDAQDVHWMTQAIELGEMGMCTAPGNPWVGCVLVNPNTQQCIGRGYHKKPGTPHAEICAIQDAIAHGFESQIESCTCYTTLEPCCHTGRTGPCSQALIKYKIGRVVIAVADTDQKVNGQGIRQLQSHDIEVITGVCRDQVVKSLRTYLYHRKYNIPWITLKMATSMDSKIASANGESQWITSEAARIHGHKYLRSTHQAILTTSNTVNADNPRFNVRMYPEFICLDTLENCKCSPKQPWVFVVADHLKLDRTLLRQQEHASRTVVITSNKILFENLNQQCPLLNRVYLVDDHHDWSTIIQCISSHDPNILSVLVECGAKFATQILLNQCAQELDIYQALTFLGTRAKSFFDHAFEDNETLENIAMQFNQFELDKTTIIDDKNLCTRWIQKLDF